MSRYIKKTESNQGPFQVRLDPNPSVKGDVETFVDITDDPQPFEDGRAQHILNSYPKLVEEVPFCDVAKEFLSVEDAPDLDAPDPRFACGVEDCGKDYATEKNLEKHRKSIHGNLLEKLLTPKTE